MLIDKHLVWLTTRGDLRIGRISSDIWIPNIVTRVPGGNYLNNPAYCNGRLYLKDDNKRVICVALTAQ